MNRTLGLMLMFFACLGGTAHPAIGQLPEIIGRSGTASQSGGIVIEPAPPKTQAGSSPSDQRAAGTELITVPSSRRLEWFAILFDGKTVGYESLATSVEVSESPSKTLQPAQTDRSIRHARVRRQRDTRLKLKRFGNDLSVSAVLETVESSDGLLESWSLRRTAADGTRLERTGAWKDDGSGYDVAEKIGGSIKQQFVPLTVQPRSPLLPAWIPGVSATAPKRWSSAVLFPETIGVVDMEISAAGSQQMTLPTGTQLVVNRFDYWPTNSPDMQSSVYCDDDGAVVRIEQPLLGQTLTIERAETAAALGQNTLDALDLEFSALLPMKRPIPVTETHKSITLKFLVGAAEQFELPTTDFQSVKRPAPGEVHVTLTPVIFPKKTTTTRPPSRVRVASEYSDSSRWVTSDHDDVKRLGIMVAANPVLPEEKCRRLTDYVYRHMRGSAFSTSLVPASVTARSLRGDCTEHAVLLCALMRSQGVPARVAVGFVYVPNPPSFAPHMWVEAFVDEKWIPYDSTRSPRDVGLTHVKVADSSLSDDVASGTVLFVPLLPLLGRATVDYVAPQDFGKQ